MFVDFKIIQLARSIALEGDLCHNIGSNQTKISFLFTLVMHHELEADACVYLQVMPLMLYGFLLQ